jgi:hypothetical protein
LDARDLIPLHKMDHERIVKLNKLDREHIRTIIPELMLWLQDGNWPVFPGVRDILLPLGKELIPHIKYVLGTNDGDWKFFVLTGLVRELSTEAIAELEQELFEIANNPTESEKASGVDEIAKELLRKIDSVI